AFLEGRTDAMLQLAYNIYPVLLAPIDPNAQVVIGYHEVRGSLGLERTWQAAHLLGHIDYDVAADFPFAYFGNLHPQLQRVIISNVDLNVLFDVRDDPVQPHRGFLFANDLQFAGGPLGGSADDVRFRPSWSMYLPLSSDVTLAARAVLGFLFPRNY